MSKSKVNKSGPQDGIPEAHKIVEVKKRDPLELELIDKRWIRFEHWEFNRDIDHSSSDPITGKINLDWRMKISFYKRSIIRKGVLALFRYKGKLVTGWSLCCDEDQFSEKTAIEIAKGRAQVLFTKNKSRDLTDIELDKLPVDIRKWAIREIHEMVSDYQVRELDVE